MFLTNFVQSFCRQIAMMTRRSRAAMPTTRGRAPRKRRIWDLGRAIESLENRSLLTTLTYTLALPNDGTNLTDWMDSGNVPQFDPSLGTLNSVSIKSDLTFVTSFAIENLSTSGLSSNNPRTITATFEGDLAVTAPGVTSLNTGVGLDSSTLTAQLFRHDGTRDFSGPDSAHFGPYTLTDTESILLTAGGDLSLYTGSGLVTFNGHATATTRFSTNANAQFLVNTTADALITVVYDYTPNSVSGYVYVDSNNDGNRAGETPIENVTINLTGTDSLNNPVSLTTLTDANGFYEFTGLRTGTYTITQVQPAGYLDGKDTIGTPGGTTANDEFSNVVIVSGTQGVENNFGELLPSSLSGHVYVDTNDDGIFQNTEMPLSGVAVTLTGTDDLGSVSITTNTDSNGFYSFPNLRPGDYTITETQPNGYLDGKDTIGTPGGITTNDVFSSIVLGMGVNGENNDFGEILPASISGFVYVDANNDGIKQNTEAVIPGTTITLTGTDDLGNPVLASTFTDANGYYVFSDLRPGQYTLTESQPTLYLDGKDTIGTPGGTTLDDVFTDINLTAGTNGVQNNFGELVPASLSGYVYVDSNDDGSRAGEAPISSTTITLSGINDLGSVLLTTTTDTNGFYSFNNLRPGTYSIVETQPAGYFDGKDTIGTPGGLTSNDAFTAINLPSGFAGIENNFGELAPATLGNFVWRDTNGNGLQDTGEPGINDVEVIITYAGADGNFATTADNVVTTVVTSTIAGQDGQYFYTGAPGNYQVTFVNPGGGYQFTSSNVGSNDAIDSDADMLTGVVAAITLASGQSNLTLDAGLVQAGIDIEKYVKEACTDTCTDNYGCNNNTSCQYEGLTPGFWKQSQHFNQWYGYSPNDKFNTVFGVRDPRGSSLTLLQALSGTGGGYQALARHAVAALLNSKHPNIAYPYSTSDIIKWVRDAYSDCRYETLKNKLESKNELGADYTKGGKDCNSPTPGNDCDTGLGEDADEAPGLVTTNGKKLVFTITVANTGDVPLANVVVRDDNGTATTADDFNPTPVLSGGFNVGDLNKDNKLDLDEVWLYQYTQDAVAGGTRTNTATAKAQPVSTTGTAIGGLVTDTDVANYTTPVANAVISGTKYLDVTGNGLTTDDRPMGGVTIKLFVDRDNNGVLTSADGAAVATQVTANTTGAYSFGNLAAGKYFVQEVVPTGYVRTNPISESYYTIDVQAGGTYGNKDFANAEEGCDCNIACVQYYINGCSTPVSDLRGRVNQGDVVEVRFNYTGYSPSKFTLVSYVAPSASFNANNAYLQTIFDVETKTVSTRGTYSMKVVVPNCYFQIDFVCGEAIDKFGPAGSNIFYSAQKRLISADNDGSKAYADSSLSGYVYVDSNCNNLRTSGEKGIANVTIKLTGKDIYGNTVSLTTKTDANGFYKFDGLNASDLDGYKISEVDPSGYADGKESVGSLGGTVGNDYFIVFVNTNENGINYNFGERK